MVCFGSKTIRPKGNRQNDYLNESFDDNSLNKRGRKDKGEKPRKGGSGSSKKQSAEKPKNGQREHKKGDDQRKGKGKGEECRSESSGSLKNRNVLPCSETSKPVQNVLRKRVDPETAKYFAEISNLFDNKEIDLDERSAICANALEETKGKELELATDAVISHILQTLIEGCELEQLCTFLLNCIESFPVIATDKSGSHVAEAALKSLAAHLEDDASRPIIEDILNRICKVIAADATNVMSSCYGSHVLRTLLCLCKGVPLDSLQNFHTTKRSAVLAERLSCGSNQLGGHDPHKFENGFVDVFKSFVRQMLHHVKNDIATLCVDKNSSLVLQTALRLSSGDDNELHHMISILLGYDEDDTIHKNDYSEKKSKIVSLLEETAYSHLLEVIVEVAPDELRNGMLAGTLRGELFAISSHHCGNYVVQALISSAKTSDQDESKDGVCIFAVLHKTRGTPLVDDLEIVAMMKQIWEELGLKFKELFELGKTGVVASILAACQRLETNRLEASQALAAALIPDSESSDSIVAYILFLENFLRERSHWKWPLGAKMSVLGCLMLQSIFQYPHQYIRQYVASLLAMEGDQILQISKDSGGSRVLEAFLCSSATTKRKFKVFAKYSRRPDQWRASQTSKETTQRKFQVEFGSNSKPVGQSIEDLFSSQIHNKKRKQKDKTEKIIEDSNTSKQDFSQRGENKRLKPTKTTSVDDSSSKTHASEGASTSGSVAFLKGSSKRKSPGFLSDRPGLKKQKHIRPVPGKSDSNKLAQDSTSMPFLKNTGRQKQSIAELADLAGKEKLTAAEVRKLLKPEMSGKT
ncbi:hypothetical protein PR202_gb07853 [Eleusine coracana subsp. coracana]|uniref:Uncharacterized protein n=1 Tax=Eleusine coracana subsp. coracana TaxID=191504 RepID=A0AAV5ED78_ELECO|nr:hypothetical protein PR202_gb07853 [Eleusine coracana subsp. coracana]